jgi:hypothetical protein
MQPVIGFFILISNNFPLAANVAANVNFYKVLKDTLTKSKVKLATKLFIAMDLILKLYCFQSKMVWII